MLTRVSGTTLLTAGYLNRTCSQRQGLSSGFNWGLRRNLTSTTTETHILHCSHLRNAPTIPSKPQLPSRPWLKVSDNALAYRWDTTAPTASQLKYADDFFLRHAPKFLWSAEKFRTMDFGNVPEVAFLGRSNVGKSSLLNALLNRKISHTSSKPGRTRSMNAFSVHDGRLVILDMPGYGKGSRGEWGKEIMKYLMGRKQLRRAFLLIDAGHGIKTSDQQLLGILRQAAVPHQILLSKVDRVLFPTARMPSEPSMERNFSHLRRFMEGMRDIVQPKTGDGPGALGEVLTCSAEKSVEVGKKMGIGGVRWAVLSAGGLESNSLGRKSCSSVVVANEEEEDEEYFGSAMNVPAGFRPRTSPSGHQTSLKLH
ncbi:MAG: GTP-binding protein [Pycnora praestabilis]|nr:MAG: GTP-binding protein [Pycnora praestabilis]